MTLLDRKTTSRKQIDRIQASIEKSQFMDWYIENWKRHGYFKYNRVPPKFIFSKDEIELMVYGSEDVLMSYYLSYGIYFFNSEFDFLANVIYDTLGLSIMPSKLEDFIVTFRANRGH